MAEWEREQTAHCFVSCFIPSHPIPSLVFHTWTHLDTTGQHHSDTVKHTPLKPTTRDLTSPSTLMSSRHDDRRDDRPRDDRRDERQRSRSPRRRDDRDRDSERRRDKDDGGRDSKRSRRDGDDRDRERGRDSEKDRSSKCVHCHLEAGEGLTRSGG